ncbi:hypothetical protein CAPTEDRAFT_122114 [Capitella teleta]|uniref:G-protein coupled receptors family 1 profile domain-containing protein n=1 Tax=Capitella teleta TaxID=283909 RepID=R7TQ76_CAPTE|nr:hypothetical protein CAPTEDRAFT_122114 [Capitella teleta]|eukprot:ELT93666.1 hypothetical protein CAPTEDRAFT_122114 [Capitella teleta]
MDAQSTILPDCITHNVIAITQQPEQQPKYAFLVTLLWLTGIIAIIGNCLVIIAFISDHRKLLRVNFNIYILNLAITDVSVASTSLPFFAMELYNGSWVYDKFTCAFWILVDWGMTFASIFFLVAISIDRYWAACWPNNYRKLNTSNRKTCIIVGIVCCVLVIWIPPFVQDRLEWGSVDSECMYSPEHHRLFSVLMMVFGYHLPSLIMAFCYFKVLSVMRKKLQESTSRPSTTTGASTSTEPCSNINTNKHRAKKAQEKRIFVSLSYILFTYLVTWSPFHFVFDISMINAELVSFQVYAYAYWMAYVNSMLNPILYAAGNTDIRNAIRDIVLLRRFRKAASP